MDTWRPLVAIFFFKTKHACFLFSIIGPCSQLYLLCCMTWVLDACFGLVGMVGLRVQLVGDAIEDWLFDGFKLSSRL